MSDAGFVGSIPQLYDTQLGPFLFEPYANDLAGRLHDLAGEVLEVAAGTGIATRALDRVLPPAAHVTATDLNPPMLEHAARQLRSPRVAWRPADGQELPFAAGSFDAVVCQFGVMFFPDRVKGYAEARRVLRPGGRYVFSTWDRLETNEPVFVLQQAIEARYPADPPRFLPRTPYGYYDPERIRADLQAAGFGDVAIEIVTIEGRAASADSIAIGLCQGSPLRGEIEARDPNGLAAATRTAAEAVEARYGGGPVTGRLQALVVTARA